MAEVMTMTADRGADVVFECSGAPPTVLIAPKLVRCRGEMIMVAIPKARPRPPPKSRGRGGEERGQGGRGKQATGAGTPVPSVPGALLPAG